MKCERYGFDRVTRTFKPSNDDATIAARVAAIGPGNKLVHARVNFWRELALFLEGDAATAGRLQMTPGDTAAIRIIAPQHVRPVGLERPVLHLDATLDETLVRCWLTRFVPKADIRVERGDGVKVRQVIDQPVGYGRIIPSMAPARTRRNVRRRTTPCTRSCGRSKPLPRRTAGATEGQRASSDPRDSRTPHWKPGKNSASSRRTCSQRISMLCEASTR